MPGYRDLTVYARACDLSEMVHGFVFLSRRAPNLPRQLKRAASSIPTVIAEGYYKSPAQYAALLLTAIAEAVEVEHHLETGRRREAIKVGDVDAALALVVEVRKMLYGLLRYIQRKEGAT